MKGYKMDGDDRVIFSKDMKIVELIDANYSLLSIFSRLNIEFPFGDISVEEMCHKNGFSADMFLAICRVYSSADYNVDLDNVTVSDLNLLLNYLKASHHYYRQVALPHIGERVEKLLEKCQEKQRLILQRFYSDYAKEVHAHLDYEEQEIFPYVESLSQSGVDSRPISEFEESHTNICDKVDDIKSIIIKYLPESCSTQERCELLCDVISLREDLERHTRLEMKILAPVAFKRTKSGAL